MKVIKLFEDGDSIAADSNHVFVLGYWIATRRSRPNHFLLPQLRDAEMHFCISQVANYQWNW